MVRLSSKEGIYCKPTLFGVYQWDINVFSGCRLPGIWIMSKQNIWRLVRDHSKKNLGWRLNCKPHFLPAENFSDRNNNDEQISLHYVFWHL